MIIGNDRLGVIENIRACAKSGDFHAKVETSDPLLSFTEAKEITDHYLKTRNTIPHKLKRSISIGIDNIATLLINKKTEIKGEFDKEILKSGIIITSNHFSPFENTVIRYFLLKNGVKKLNIVSQVTNFAMSGAVGFLMKYADTIPISSDVKYISRDFMGIIKEKLSKKEAVLIYPEQEMWFNYRKPRPPKDGAYHFAAKAGCPILSCFVEIIDIPELESTDFYKTKYRLHILGFIYPDDSLSVRENTRIMAQADYNLKKDAYEKIYKRKLDYTFHNSDIAGWINYSEVIENE